MLGSSEWAEGKAVEGPRRNREVWVIANTTYHVALAIRRTEEGDLVAEDAVEAASPAAAVGRARQIASSKLGAIAFSRSGDPDLGEYGDARDPGALRRDTVGYRAARICIASVGVSRAAVRQTSSACAYPSSSSSALASFRSGMANPSVNQP